MPAAYSSTTDFTVASGQNLQATDQDVLWLSQSSGAAAPGLAMQGASELYAIADAAFTGSEIYAVRGFGDLTGASFTMAAQSQINVQERASTPLYFAGYGIAATSSPNLTLGGGIQVTVFGQATGILAPFSSAGGSVTLQSSFMMAVTAQQSGAAYGVRMESGGAFQNLGGEVQANATTVAYGVLISGDGGSFNNAGIITAGGLGEFGGYGVAAQWEAGGHAATTSSFVNDGALHGDYALVVSAAVPDPAAQIFTNNGSMYGEVDLAGAPSQLINTGQIYGKVVFGAANGLYDGRAGTVSGSVSGGAGDDTLIGGAEGETLAGGAGNDSVVGGVGNDVIDGGAGRNTLYAGAGDDSIIGGTGVNQINGNKGQDTIVGRSQSGDSLFGGQGQDSIDASASTGHNYLNGNLGNDTLRGGGSGDTLRGGQGDDVIYAGSGNDWISGDLGTNTIYGGQGADTFHASPGHDLVDGWHAGDEVLVDAGVSYSVSQVGGDVHVVFSTGGEMDLIGVQKSSLPSGWIVSG